MDPSQGEKTTMDRETMDPSQGEKTTDREILAPSEGERTIDLIPKAKGFLEDHFARWVKWVELQQMLAEQMLADEELAEKKIMVEEELANLYREDSLMNFDGENIQGKEAIRAKLTSLKPSRIQVLKIEWLSVGGTGFFGSTGFDSGTGLVSGTGFSSGTIWPDGKQDASSGTGFDSGTGGTGFNSGGTGFSSSLQGVASGCIWLDGKLDACLFSQMFVLHPTPEGSFDISHSIFLCPGI